MTDLKRLGKRGAYGLGQLATQGEGPQRPAPFQPRFVRRAHRWPGSVWLLGLLAGALIIAGAAAAGWWFMPFVIGLLAGLANHVGRWPTQVALPVVVVMSATGWLVPLLWSVLHGARDGGVARNAALLGLPGNAAVAGLLTVLIAVVQGMTGYWLGRALTPLPTDDLGQPTAGDLAAAECSAGWHGFSASFRFRPVAGRTSRPPATFTPASAPAAGHLAIQLGYWLAQSPAGPVACGCAFGPGANVFAAV